VIASPLVLHRLETPFESAEEAMFAPRLGATRAVPRLGGCRRPQSASATAAGGGRRGGGSAVDGGMDEAHLRALLEQGDGSLPPTLVQKLSELLTEGSSAERGALMALLNN